LAGLRGRWLAHCEGLKQEELCAREEKGTAGLLQRLLGHPDSAPHGVHQAPRAPGCPPQQRRVQLVGACPWVPGLPPTAPAHGKEPLSQELQEAQSAPTWKPSEQLAESRAPSREEEAAPPRLAQALLGWSRMHLQEGRAPALLRGPIRQSSWREAALPWARLAQTCLAARLPAQEGASCARLGDGTGAFLASAPLLPCLCT